ncbi:MAG: serine hydrolase domain-containing protein, partial [Acidobacteriota bacterium]
MPKQRFSTCLLLLLIPIGLLLLIPSLWVFVSVTAKPIHPIPDTLPSTTQSAPSPDAAAAVEKARQIVRASVAAQNLPGASVAVGINGNLVWAEGFGFADIRTSVPVTPNHRFRIGTASAMLTSAAAGLLLEKGRLNLDSEIQTYVPSFPKKQWPVTLRQLMSHTAGLPTGEGPLRRQHCEHPAEALQYFAQSPLLFQPGTQYRYSDYGWIVA